VKMVSQPPFDFLPLDVAEEGINVACFFQSIYIHTHTRLTALFPGLPG